MNKTLLVIGVSGLTGYKIAKQASSDFEVYGTFNFRPIKINSCNITRMDVTNPKDLEKIREIKPDVIINTSALHNVDYCETNQDEATKVNSTAPMELNHISQKIGSRLIHISTDYVFDGYSKVPYTEEVNPNPINFYAKSKLEGEKNIGSGGIIIRPSVVYGWAPLELAGTTSSSGKPMNFALWALTKMQNKEPLKIVTDQYASATLADSLAESILAIAASKERSGVYHISGLSCESRYEFTVKLAKKFGYNSSLISPASSSDFKQKAKRPFYSCLNCQEAIKQFRLKLLRTEEALGIMKSQVEKEAPRLLGKDNILFDA